MYVTNGQNSTPRVFRRNNSFRWKTRIKKIKNKKQVHKLYYTSVGKNKTERNVCSSAAVKRISRDTLAILPAFLNFSENELEQLQNKTHYKRT